MLPGFSLARLLWFVLLVSTLLAFNVGCAEAEEVLASWYGPGLKGKPTASGEPYDPTDYTAAHRTLPLGTELIVSYGGRSVPVTVNDRGPYVGEAELDLSQAAAQELGLTRIGIDYVDWRYANEPGPAQGVAQEPGSVEGGINGASPQDYPKTYAPGQDLASDAAYTVQPGDTLFEIAARLGTTVDELASYNGITDPNIIYSGQTLYFPALGEATVGAGGTPMANDAAAQSLDVPVGGEVLSGYSSANEELPVPVGGAIGGGEGVGPMLGPYSGGSQGPSYGA